ncbi:MAG: DUF1624 domain-containing protein [Clostridiales bacterium]|nr:DUF1624 domain-containing protein [Clostridiales bacterium]
MKNACNKTYTATADRTSPAPLFAQKRMPRIHGLDFLRGLCVILMIFDHISFDFMWLPEFSYNFYEADNPFLTGMQSFCETWWNSTLRICVRLPVVCLFFIISGISSSFSRNNFLRGVKLALASATLSLFTVLGDTFFDLGISIYFGVLHCFTVSVLLFAVLQLLLKDKAKYACLGLGVLFFVWGLLIDFYDPPYLYAVDGHALSLADYWQLAVGLKAYGADSFGILPNTGVFLLGCYGGAQLYKQKLPYLPLFAAKPFAPVCFVGRKAVWFYLLHQPVVLAVVGGIAMALGLRFF